MKIDWIGFNIDKRYFVGYGLDLKQIFRGLPGIYAVNHWNWTIKRKIIRIEIITKNSGKV